MRAGFDRWIRDHRGGGRWLLCALSVTAIALAMPVPAAAGETPLDLVVVLDNSGSMKRNDPQRLTPKVVMELARNVGADARVGLVVFDERATLVQPLVTADAEGARRVEASLGRLDYRGLLTNSGLGIERALYELQIHGRSGAARAIVFLSDGVIDTGDANKDVETARWLREDLASESERAGIRIFGVAFTEAADFRLIQALSVRTRGRYYRAETPGDLAGVVERMRVHIEEMARPAAPEAPVPPPVVVVAPAPAPAAPVPAVASATPEEPEFGLGRLALVVFSLAIGVGVVAGLFAGLTGRRRTRGSLGAGGGLAEAFERAAPAAQIVDVGGGIAGPGVPLALCRSRTRIGRGPDNDIVIDDPTISGLHATIDFRDGDFWLEDRRSTNGSTLGGTRMEAHEPAKLEPGDRFSLAGFELQFVMPDFAASDATVFQAIPIQRSAGAPSFGGARTAEGPAEIHAQGPSLAALRDPEAGVLSPRPGDPDYDDVARQTSLDDAPTLLGDASEGPGETTVLGTPPSDAAPPSTPFRDCLDACLERIAPLGAELAEFVEKRFEDDMRGALAMTARDLAAEASESGRIAVRQHAREQVLYLSCAVPGDLDEARRHLASEWGGLTRMISAFLNCEAFVQGSCDVLVLAIYGEGGDPWVGLSIVTAEGYDAPLDVLSFELLSDDEAEQLDSLECLPAPSPEPLSG